jgi:hypothetical protein
MLIAQGSQTPLLSSQTLGLLERLAHRLGTNLCVLVVPFFLSISAFLFTRKDEEEYTREELTPSCRRHGGGCSTLSWLVGIRTGFT